MKQIDFWFDPVSPFSYLAFERLPQALEGLSHDVRYRPILFAGLLAHWGQKGPAEIEPKRAWTFRQAHWLAHAQGIEMDTPLRHPFNPLALLRLLLASAAPGGFPNRRVCELVLRHVWRGGLDATDPVRFEALAQAVAPRVAPDDPVVKQALKASTAEAVGRGLFRGPDHRGRWQGILGCRRVADGRRLLAWRCLVRGPGLGARGRAEGRDSPLSRMLGVYPGSSIFAPRLPH